VTPVAAALVPLALLIALGFGLRRAAFLPGTFWAGLDRLNYWVLFPALIFVSLAEAQPGLQGARVVAVVWGSLALVALAALGLRRVLAPDGPAFTSVFQGAVRFNSFAAFGAIPVLFPGSAAVIALLVAATVPLVNLMCVLVLARHASPTPLRGARLVRSVVANPLIVASLAGIVVQHLGWTLGPLAGTLHMLGDASLASGLLSVGATLAFGHVRRSWRPVVASTALKFAVLPGAALMLGTVAGLPAEVLAPVVVFQALPTASAAFVLARAMGGDERLMAGILAVQTVAAMAWLPLVFALAIATT
jgi:predicted permease